MAVKCDEASSPNCGNRRRLTDLIAQLAQDFRQRLSDEAIVVCSALIRCDFRGRGSVDGQRQARFPFDQQLPQRGRLWSAAPVESLHRQLPFMLIADAPPMGILQSLGPQSEYIERQRCLSLRRTRSYLPEVSLELLDDVRAARVCRFLDQRQGSTDDASNSFGATVPGHCAG
jgi:hypothetical protein